MEQPAGSTLRKLPKECPDAVVACYGLWFQEGGEIPINEILRFCLDLSDLLILYRNFSIFIKEIGDM